MLTCFSIICTFHDINYLMKLKLTSNLLCLPGTSIAVMSAKDLNCALVWSCRYVRTGKTPSGAMSISNSLLLVTCVCCTYFGKTLPMYSPYSDNLLRTGSSEVV